MHMISVWHRPPAAKIIFVFFRNDGDTTTDVSYFNLLLRP